jgi:DNA-binding CsgD family transcriptional regulator
MVHYTTPLLALGVRAHTDLVERARVLGREHDVAAVSGDVRRVARTEALVRSGAPAAEAQRLLSTAAATAGSLGARPLLDEMTKLARRARLDLDGAAMGTAPRQSDDVLGLTDRERDVLLLLAEGRTTRQIGEQLFISEKTASVHVSRILAKLGVSNRAEAPGVATRSGSSRSGRRPMSARPHNDLSPNRDPRRAIRS